MAGCMCSMAGCMCSLPLRHLAHPAPISCNTSRWYCFVSCNSSIQLKILYLHALCPLLARHTLRFTHTQCLALLSVETFGDATHPLQARGLANLPARQGQYVALSHVHKDEQSPSLVAQHILLQGDRKMC